MVSNIFDVHPDPWGRWTQFDYNMFSLFFRWVVQPPTRKSPYFSRSWYRHESDPWDPWPEKHVRKKIKFRTVNSGCWNLQEKKNIQMESKTFSDFITFILNFPNLSHILYIDYIGVLKCLEFWFRRFLMNEERWTCWTEHLPVQHN